MPQGTPQPLHPEQPFIPEQANQRPDTRPSLPEQPTEAAAEQREDQKIATEKEGFIPDTIESLKQALRLSKKPRKVQIPQVRDAITVKVEHIMEEGIADAFRAMTPVQQQEFKLKGEETAHQIGTLLKKAHVQVKKIFRLLLEWLRLIPGVNKFFLMQEAKIKADKIISLKQLDDGNLK